jgi:endonuclease-3 related protein
VLAGEFGGDLNKLFAGETSAARERLLAIHGIGPETADSMLLYAGGHRSFVIDAYTKRIFSRHGWCSPDAGYDDLKLLCESALKQKTGEARLDYWRDYHAQLVMVGKHFCRTRAPRCETCPLKPLLPRKTKAG